MPSPTEDLVDALEATGDFAEVNLHPFPMEKVVAPALVVRPDTPWIEPDRFCADLEHYVALVAVTANYPQDQLAEMRRITLAMIAALPEGWAWVSTDGPVVDQTTGTPFLVNRSRLTYSNKDEDS